MSDDIYAKLVERINQFDVKFASVDSFVALLKEMYSEEEAELAASFPSGSFTLGQLGLIFRRDEIELTRVLEAMADKGTVLSYPSEGQRKYELPPFFPGAIEFHWLSGVPNRESLKKMARLYVKTDIETRALVEKLLAEDPEKAMALASPRPALRTVTIEEALPEEKEFHSYDSILKMIENETSIAAMRCTCRDLAVPVYGAGPCQVPGIPDHSCLFFGKTADFLIERKIGDARRINREECKELLEVCRKAGLVQNANNFADGLRLICNCCKCCCGLLQNARQIGPAALINTANFAPQVNAENCIGCGACADRCPLNAIQLKDDLPDINSDACIGCGHCAAVCPVNSISMIRVTHKRLNQSNKPGDRDLHSALDGGNVQ